MVAWMRLMETDYPTDNISDWLDVRFIRRKERIFIIWMSVIGTILVELLILLLLNNQSL